MSHVSFKELCLDTDRTDGAAGRFWAAATGCRFTEEYTSGSGDVVGDEESMGIAICPVPEPKTVKNRVHLDLAVHSVDELTALGATVTGRVEEGDHSWTVLADPEGNELCAFVKDEVPPYSPFELCVDCTDPESVGRWWAEVFGLVLHQERDWFYLKGVPGTPFRYWVFAAVPEPKTVKNRLHWDLYGDVDDLLARGATKLWEMERWTVLADPEGNEFCVFPRR